MRLLLALLIALCVGALCVGLVSPAWADERPESAPSEPLRVEDLPKPIPELLQRLKKLSAEIEPEITKLGSRLGAELEQTVKKLEAELKKHRHSD